MKSNARGPRLQFSLQTLVWIMLVVAAFFAGRISMDKGSYWSQWSRPRPRPIRVRDTSVGLMVRQEPPSAQS